MSITNPLVALVAWTIPGPARVRYQEEWQADLAGARELGLSQRSVVAGVLMTAMTIDRADPQVTGITKARLITNRLRWAAAFLGSAAVLGVGTFLRGGRELFSMSTIGFGFSTLALLFGVLGLFACLGALDVAVGVNGRRTALVLGTGVVAVAVFMAALLVMPLIGILAVPAALALFIIVASGTREPSSSRVLPIWRRALLALPFTVLTLVIVAAGVLHITVWNPLARVPGLSLDEIYSAMASANESPVAGFIVGWAIFWAAASLVLLVLACIPWLSSFLTVRRIIVSGLLLVGATAGFTWLAGFNMGMSLADTFMTSGGDAALSGPAISLVGQIALVAALFFGLAPPLMRGVSQRRLS